MSIVILSLGTAMPTHSIAQHDAAELAKAFCCQTEEQARVLPTLYKRTRIQRRGSVLLGERDGAGPQQSFFFAPAGGAAGHGPMTGERMQRYAQDAPLLALTAARRALVGSRLAASQLSHLVTVSCTGFVAPGVDIRLIKALGLAQDVGRVHIGFMGCHGALNGLRVASALVSASPGAGVLLCAVELCSLHFCYGWDAEKVVSNALFADGAAALIVARAAGRPADHWQVAAMGSCLFPDSEDAMTWRIGDHGFEMTLSASVPALITTHLRPWLERWLRQQGFTLSQVRSWAIHPGGPRLLNSVAESLHLPSHATAASRGVLAECGNMSSPTLLFILERLQAERAPRPCVALGFGPGLVAEAALFI